MRKRILAMLLVLVMCVSLLPVGAFAATASGTDGNITWSLDDAGTLTISGAGAMKNYSSKSYSGTYATTAPWGQYYADIKSVVIPDSVTSIGSCAFYGCSRLTSVTIGNGVQSIGSYAFRGCSGLTGVYITDLAAWCGIAFGDLDTSQPLCYAHNLYLNGELVTDLVIPDSVQSIGSYAFYHCSGLTSVTIPDSVTSIGRFAFFDCSGLTSVTIGNSVKSIGDYAFGYCSSLTSVTIPDSVQSIGYGAFLYCGGLSDVYYSGAETQWNKINKGNGNDDLLNATIHYNWNGGDIPTSKYDGTPITLASIDFKYNVSQTSAEGNWVLPYADSYLSGDSTKFDQDLAVISLGLTMASTNRDSIGAIYLTDMLNNMGFDKSAMYVSPDYAETQKKTDTCEYVFAVKKLAGTDDYVVPVVIRSNDYGGEWISNAHVFEHGYDSRYATGFKKAADGVYNQLKQYIKELTDLGIDAGHIKLWVTGFSRGGAIANLIGGRLMSEGITGISSSNIYVYGFAVPRTVQKYAADKYKNIFNIVNQGDVVPRVPLKAWGFERYGVDMFLPCVSKNSLKYSSLRVNMEKYFGGMMVSSGLNTKYSLVTAQERTLDVLLAYLADIIPSEDSYYFDGYQATIEHLCEMWKIDGTELDINLIFEEIFGMPSNCTEALLGIFEDWQDENVIERAASITAFEYLLDEWADGDGSYQVEKIRKMIKSLLGHISLYVAFDFTALNVFTTSKTGQYIELAELIADLIKQSKADNAFGSTLLMQHWPETYLSWMMSGKPDKVYSDGSYKVLFAKCPVDITVYDESENVVARIVNDEIDESVEGLYCELNAYGEKSIFIPDDGEYRTVITAREDGRLDIVEQRYSADGELLGADCYIELPMVEYQVFEVNVNEDTTVRTNDEVIEPDTVLNDENETVSITAVAQDGGYVTGAKEYSLGETVELFAQPNDDHHFFTGWYEGGQLVSNDSSIHFSAVKDRDFEARFVFRHTYVSPIITAPTCTTQGYTTYTCECGESYADNYVDAKGHSFALGKCQICGEPDPDYDPGGGVTKVSFFQKIINFIKSLFSWLPFC